MIEPEYAKDLGPLVKREINLDRAFDLISHRFYLSVLTFDCLITHCSGKIERQDLPFFLGPTLRGAFGFALKEYCCDHPDPLWREKLKECPQECDCAYKTIFLSPAQAGLPPPYRGRTYKPHPFTLRAPWLESLQKSMRFAFELTIIGEAHRAVSGFIDGFVLAGIKGLKAKKWSFNFGVEAVHQLCPDGKTYMIWRSGKGFFNTSGSFNSLADFIDEKAVAIFDRGVQVRLNSPLDMVIDRKTITHLSQIEESSLAARLAGSLEELGVFWCGMPPLGGKPVLKGSMNLPIEKTGEWIYQKERLSVQEGNRMPLRGLMGTFHIPSPKPETVRILAAMLHIGLGQNRTFGFGRYDLYPAQ